MARDGASADEPCWCVRERFPRRLLDSLAVVEGPARCLCRDCLERARREDAEEPGTP